MWDELEEGSDEYNAFEAVQEDLEKILQKVGRSIKFNILS